MPAGGVRACLGSEPFPPQAQRIRHHKHTRKRHRRRREHGQQTTQHRHWDQHDVIDERPEEILVDGAQGRFAQGDGCGDGVEVAADQRDIAGFDGDIGTSADGETDGRACASAGASLMPSPTMATGLAFRRCSAVTVLGFVGGQDLGKDALDANDAGDGFGGAADYRR